jgi:hypothetical protein
MDGAREMSISVITNSTGGGKMQIVGFEIATIEAKRFSKVGEHVANVRIDHNSTVTQITKVSDDVASIEYRFTANYAGMGFIKIEGTISVQGEVPMLMQEWGATGSMPNETANVVHNTVVSNCIPTALLIARDIRLPPPFPLPRINIEKKTAPVNRPSGPEFA